MRRDPKALAIASSSAAVVFGSGLLLWFVLGSGGLGSVGPAPQVPERAAAPVPAPEVALADEAEAPAADPAEEAPTPVRYEPGYDVVSGVLRRGESLGRSLGNLGIPAAVVHQVATEMAPVFNFRYAKPGDAYRLVRDREGRVVDFEYTRSPLESYRLWLSNDQYRVEKRIVELEKRPARLAGIVNASLYEAVTSLGEQPQLASDFADIFAWDVDFSRAVRPGDEFRMLYERLYRPKPDGEAGEEYVRPGRILAAHYSGAAGEHTAVHFEFEGGKGGYYRPDGSSVKRQFLKAPLQFRRISSRYSLARFHPVLKVTRPHQGIDYAAATGTPVWSVADGKVIHKGWVGGFGRLIKVRHSNGYVSMYGHLSRYAGGLTVGKRVQQKQVIGYVGSSGLSTGPHLDFRIKKNGRYVNPTSLRSPAGDPIPETARETFDTTRDELLSELGTSLVATREAL